MALSKLRAGLKSERDRTQKQLDALDTAIRELQGGHYGRRILSAAPPRAYFPGTAATMGKAKGKAEQV